MAKKVRINFPDVILRDYPDGYFGIINDRVYTRFDIPNGKMGTYKLTTGTYVLKDWCIPVCDYIITLPDEIFDL